jgi:hypothetical protein
LIAQEVEPLVPEAVVKDENPEHAAGMNYSTFIPILIKAIQEQQTLTRNQGSLLEAQQSRMRELENRLRAIEKNRLKTCSPT